MAATSHSISVLENHEAKDAYSRDGIGVRLKYWRHHGSRVGTSNIQPPFYRQIAHRTRPRTLTGQARHPW